MIEIVKYKFGINLLQQGVFTIPLQISQFPLKTFRYFVFFSRTNFCISILLLEVNKVRIF